MSKKRDLLREIQAKKERTANQYVSLISIDLSGLRRSFERHLEINKAWPLKTGLYVVGIVACIEVGVRYSIQTLIDHGRPFIERVSGFKDTLSLDFNIALALHDKRVSFGDLVSHLLPVSNVAHINSHFEVLFERAFKEVLAGVREFVEPEFSETEETSTEQEPEEEAEPTLLPIADVDALMAKLSSIFRARHNTAHEADFDSVTNEELAEFFKTAEIFLHALDEIVRQIIEPNMPRHAPGQAMIAVQESGEAAARMDAFYQKATTLAANVEATLDTLTQAEALRDSQEAFERYLEAELVSRGMYSSKLAGTGMRTHDANVRKELYAHRTQMLSELIDDLDFDAMMANLQEE